MLSQVIISKEGFRGFVSANQRLCVNPPKRVSCQINKDPEISPFRTKLRGVRAVLGDLGAGIAIERAIAITHGPRHSPPAGVKT